jgi:hypothetical protein
VRELLTEGTEQSGLSVVDANPMADMIVARLGSVGCKIGLRLTERAVAMTGRGDAEEDTGKAQITSLEPILDDPTSDEVTGQVWYCGNTCIKLKRAKNESLSRWSIFQTTSSM